MDGWIYRQMEVHDAAEQRQLTLIVELASLK